MTERAKFTASNKIDVWELVVWDPTVWEPNAEPAPSLECNSCGEWFQVTVEENGEFVFERSSNYESYNNMWHAPAEAWAAFAAEAAGWLQRRRSAAQ